MFPTFLVIFTMFFQEIHSKILKNSVDLCNNLECDEKVPVCAIKREGEGFILKLFDNECGMLNMICGPDEKIDYEIIDLKYCDKAFRTKPNTNKCRISDCPHPKGQSDSNSSVCGIKRDGEGFRIHLFQSNCELWLHNCKYDVKFVEDHLYLCDGLQKQSIEYEETNKRDLVPKDVTDNPSPIIQRQNASTKNGMKQKSKLDGPIVVIVDNMLTFKDKNISRSIDNFFETTHIFDLPLEELNEHTAGSGRRMWIRNAGPNVVFKPTVIVPKNISDDYDHIPTLSSCYHKCPTKCPDTYSPVCGVPGDIAREPSLMFQNHCFMDVAQCKMHREDKSETAYSSAYKEASFVFCLGVELNSLYRFLPLVKTLQHMGRIKKKGYFRQKITNMKFFSNMIIDQPRIMG